MRAFVLRCLRNGLPVAVLLAALGYGMSQMAEMMHGKSDRAKPADVPELAGYLQYRMAGAMAAWGFGIVVVFEGLFSLWRKPVAAGAVEPKLTADPMDEAERLLLQLLDQADAAERARTLPSPADPTPPPRGDLAAVPADATRVPQAN